MFGPKFLVATLLLLSSSTVAFLIPSDQASLADQHRSVQNSRDDLSKIILKSPLLSLHKALVEVESISSYELAVGKLLVSTLEAHNFAVTTQQVNDVNNASLKRWNIYATPDSSQYPSSSSKKQPHPKVILTSHIDTVPPYIPYSLSRPKSSDSREDILISGRGTVDAKACVAAMVQATLSLLASPKTEFNPSDVALLFVVGEETRGDGMNHFSDSKLYHHTNSNLKAVIFGEPTELKLASGHKGITMAHIKAHGKAAHSGYPWLGQSATSMILPALYVLDKLGDLLPEEGGLPRSKEFGNSTVNVGYISAGVAANVVPEFAEAKVSFRLAGGTTESVKKIILNAISGADPQGLLDVDIYQGYAPVPLDTDVDGFDSIVVNYGTDVPNLKVADGVKRYLYGPGSILVAHGKDEGLTVGALEQAVEDYQKLIKHALSL
ncbi:hypothetical protein H2198_005639 [Neophaeococcomyces mojaviensis]|uniref:Uncharacterized protein n=1 Tax=Neophaeococcomyces mojaviensis TaxID=3383035 RepID=A0ACC3A5A2_9EURO|nr:hypothetical protein H2198_005639 [Knufia sp. JES_112]